MVGWIGGLHRAKRYPHMKVKQNLPTVLNQWWLWNSPFRLVEFQKIAFTSWRISLLQHLHNYKNGLYRCNLHIPISRVNRKLQSLRHNHLPHQSLHGTNGRKTSITARHWKYCIYCNICITHLNMTWQWFLKALRKPKMPWAPFTSTLHHHLLQWNFEYLKP